MPKKINRIGQYMGSLIVLREGETLFAGKSYFKRWWVKCKKCGCEELMRFRDIESKQCCSVCFRGPCIVCGVAILIKTRSNKCSPECERIAHHARSIKSQNSDRGLKYRQDYYKNNKDLIREKWKRKFESFNEENLMEHRYQKNLTVKRSLEHIKTSPIRYEEYRNKKRKQKTKELKEKELLKLTKLMSSLREI